MAGKGQQNAAERHNPSARAAALENAQFSASNRTRGVADICLQPYHIAVHWYPALVGDPRGHALSFAPTPGRPGRQSLVGDVNRARQRCANAGPVGHGSDVAWVSILEFVSGLQDSSLTVPSPPPWLADFPVVGQKLTETWVLVETNMPAALAKYGKMLGGVASWLASFAGGLAAGQLSFVLSFAVAAVLIAYGEGVTEFATRLLERITGSKAQGPRLVAMTAATIRGVASASSA